MAKRVGSGQLCDLLDISGHGRRLASLPVVGAILVPPRPREKPSGWIIIRADSRNERDALTALERRHVRVRTRLTNGVVLLEMAVHTRDEGEGYGGTTRLAMRGRPVPALVTVCEQRELGWL